jgi:hypothetical protein
VIAAKLVRSAWHRISPETPVERVSHSLPQPDRQDLVRSGVAAGATIVALSAASALTSAIRRRVERA